MAKKTKERAAIKWHGGKSYLADWIISLMPPRVKNPNAPAPDDPGWCHYVEPYFGGGAVLFAQDPEGIGEVVNDINEHLTNFWTVLQKPHYFERFAKLCEVTPCSQVEFKRAAWSREDISDDPVDAAVAFFIRNRQSRQALGKDFATLAKTRTRRGMNELPSAWLSAIDGLPEIHARLQRVVILNGDAIEVIRQQDGPRTLFYLDPPYLHETREANSRDAYAHEMTEEDHERLLMVLGGSIAKPVHMRNGIKGRFMLSGYHSNIYDATAKALGWKCHELAIPNHSSGKAEKEVKTECVWTNF